MVSVLVAQLLHAESDRNPNLKGTFLVFALDVNQERGP